MSVPWRAWQRPLGDDAPLELDPLLNGKAEGVPYAERFANQALYHDKSTPVAGFWGFGYTAIAPPDAAPVYWVSNSSSLHRRPIVWVDDNGADAPSTWANRLQSHFERVPVPAGPNGELFEDFYGRSLAAAGEDRQLSIYNQDTGELWEAFGFRYNRNKSRYEMSYGGYTPDVTREGMAFPNYWGARATSLPLSAGTMLQAEYAAGEFRHPLEVAIPVVKDGFIPPATRQDGILRAAVPSGDTRDAVPEGAWFRLPPDFPIDPSKPKLWRMIVKAARDYGIVVGDQSGGSVTFSAEAPNAIGTPFSDLTTPAFPLGVGHSDSLYWGSNNVLNTFPWHSLVQVKPLA